MNISIAKRIGKMKLLSFALALALIFTSVPVGDVFASESGSAGSSSNYTLDGGVLTITGSRGVTTCFTDKAEDITEIVIGEGISSLGDDCFRDLSNVTSITLPSTLESIGSYSLSGLASLEEINLAQGSIFFNVEDGVLYSKNMKILYLYPAAMAGDTFTIPSSVTDVDVCAFGYSQNLETLNIPASVTNVGSDNPFADSSIEEFVVDSANTKYKSVGGSLCQGNTTLLKFGRANATDPVVIGSSDGTGIKNVALGAFAKNTTVENIVFDTSVSSLAFGSLSGCLALESITVLNSECNIGSVFFGTSIGNQVTVYGYEGSTAETFANRFGIDFEPLAEKTPVSISIDTLPAKLTYKVGDEFNPYGLKVLVNYSDDTSQLVSDNLTFSNTDFSTVGTKSVTVSYGEFETSFDVQVVDSIAEPVLVQGDNTVPVMDAGDYSYGTFTPSRSAKYAVYSESSFDTAGIIKNENDETIDQNDDKGSTYDGYDDNYYMECNMYVGHTYRIGTKINDDGAVGNVKVVIEYLQDAVEPKTYNYITVDGESQRVERGSTFTLPSEASVGYVCSGKLYRPGSEITVNEDMEFTGIGLTMSENASIRIDESSAIRCSATLGDVSDIDVREAGGLFTASSVYKITRSITKAMAPGRATLVSVSGSVVENGGTYTVAIAGLGEDSYTKGFYARAYADVVYDGNGESNVVTVYSDIVGEHSVRTIALAIRTSPSYNYYSTRNKLIIKKLAGEE